MNLSAAGIREFVFPLWVRREHPAFPSFLMEFSRNQYLTRADLEALQLRRLRSLLEHSYQNCEFYRERMDRAGMAKGAISSLADLARLPVLTKSDIQKHGAEMLAKNVPETERQRNQTGGSTGSPLQFWVDTERFASRMASTVRHNEWASYRIGEWCAYLWGARMDMQQEKSLWNTLRNNLLYRRLELNTSEVSASDWDEFIAKVKRYRPPVLLAYARSAVEFAHETRKRGVKIQFRSMITTAEVLTSEQRRFLEDSFGGKVFNRYGCREVSVIASECKHHTGLHVNADALFVEVQPDSGLPDGNGRLLITDLLNRSMPLIRYEIGDASRWAERQACPCGRSLPLLENIEGRTTEFLVMPDGRVISGPALTLIVADLHDVAQVQFVQETEREVQLRVVPGAGYGEHSRQELRRRLGLYLKGAVRLTLVEVESIRKELSGKYRFVINRLQENKGTTTRN